MSEHVLIERRGHVMEITLDKPKVNAIDHEMSKAIADAFVKFDTVSYTHLTLPTILLV